MYHNEGELEKALRELGEAKEKFGNTILASSLGKLLIACVEFLDGMLKRFQK